MADNPVQLIIRFTTSTPDLPLLISSPQAITTIALKQKIRVHLPPSTSSNRLRLIHSGKVLPDTALLSSALSILLPPPQSDTRHTTEKHSSSSDLNDEKSAKSKGKEPIRNSDRSDKASIGKVTSVPRVYIHCSIGDALSPGELEAEAHAALSSTHVPPSQTPLCAFVTPAHPPSPASLPASSPSQPLGFDRLLSANFTREDVASLRAQFLALQQHTHTPDMMPRGRELRLLEELWLDSEAYGPPNAGETGLRQSGAGTEGAGATAVAEGGGISPMRAAGANWGLGTGTGFGEDSGLEDMLVGNIMGFFWPLGALSWLLREEGVWTQRRQIAVFTGMVVNAAFGFWRMAG
ncbi:MAG: hypothetical protein M1821_003566 [Bathelium mastoideum]|nr:MAG: hypothetical protein M1821_003566 [Bathelium mastoideum]KAI9684854.1 MAG: hypothetical protein M1822_005502 [Bathelium mastoideum]